MLAGSPLPQEPQNPLGDRTQRCAPRSGSGGDNAVPPPLSRARGWHWGPGGSRSPSSPLSLQVEPCDTATQEGPRWQHELQSDTEFVFQARCRLSSARSPWSSWSPPFIYSTPEAGGLRRGDIAGGMCRTHRHTPWGGGTWGHGGFGRAGRGRARCSQRVFPTERIPRSLVAFLLLWVEKSHQPRCRDRSLSPLASSPIRASC